MKAAPGPRYDLTIRTLDGVRIDILRNERTAPDSKYFMLFSDLPPVRKRMAEMGVAVIDREVLAVLIRDGFIRQWN